MRETRTRIGGGAFARLRELAPDVVTDYETLAERTKAAGPLDAPTVALVKVAVSIGIGSWRSVHAHARKALEAGVTPEALRHAAVAALPTVGLPATLDALRWIDETIREREENVTSRPR
jgi:alkylhydroperoxidase/carboxymuconolactone decarboxylase family protein YurZ